MISLSLNPAEAELLMRILELYNAELHKAAAGAPGTALDQRRQAEEPLLKDLIGQLAAQPLT